MTLEQLRHRVTRSSVGSGCYCIVIVYKCKFYKCTSNNYPAVVRIWNTVAEPWEVVHGYTEKQAYMSLWNECLYKNYLRYEK